MKSYIKQVSVINKTSFGKRDFSLSGKDYRQLKVSENSKPLSTLIQESYQGKEIGSASYMKRSKYRFLKTVNLTDNFGISEESIEYCRPENIAHPQIGDILIAKDGGGDGLGECALYNLQNSDNTDSISAGVLGLRTNKENRYYLLGLLKSKHFKNFVDLNTPQGSTIRHSKKVSLNYPVPFPKVEEVQNIISLITQNILDKEEKIKLKNQKIDELIEDELKENQKVGTFEFRLPRISEIRNETRIDTGLYEKKYRETVYLIDSYKNSNFDLLEKYTAKRGQNLQITNIGLSIYSDVEKPNFYRLMTNIELTDQRTVSKFRWLGSGKKLTLIPKNTIFLSADGTVGRCMYITDLGKTITNIHPWIINRKKIGVNQIEDIFTAMFLGWLYKKGFYEKIKDKANGGGIKYNHLERYLKIPNFPESKQEEIAKEYYNPINKNSDLNFDNYLEKEKARNAEAGIFQLNMELFSLREKLEDLVDKIVKDEKIYISFDY